MPQASYSWDGWYKATVKHDDISEKRFRGMSKNKDKAIEQAIASCELSNKNSAHKCYLDKIIFKWCVSKTIKTSKWSSIITSFNRFRTTADESKAV